MIFISYRISNSLDLVGRLDADLSREFGQDAVFRGKTRLQPGRDWTHQLDYRGKAVWLIVLLVCGFRE
jgi:hypothetical protein